MAASNDPAYRVFKGEGHPRFKYGESYTIAMYSDWTIENCQKGGVKRSTMKGRLLKAPHCLPEHLLHLSDYIARPNKPERKKPRIRTLEPSESALTNCRDNLSQRWLCRAIV